jgi:hypothetical protein
MRTGYAANADRRHLRALPHELATKGACGCRAGARVHESARVVERVDRFERLAGEPEQPRLRRAHEDVVTEGTDRSFVVGPLQDKTSAV